MPGDVLILHGGSGARGELHGGDRLRDVGVGRPASAAEASLIRQRHAAVTDFAEALDALQCEQRRGNAIQHTQENGADAPRGFAGWNSSAPRNGAPFRSAEDDIIFLYGPAALRESGAGKKGKAQAERWKPSAGGHKATGKTILRVPAAPARSGHAEPPPWTWEEETKTAGEREVAGARVRPSLPPWVAPAGSAVENGSGDSRPLDRCSKPEGGGGAHWGTARPFSRGSLYCVTSASRDAAAAAGACVPLTA
jgi:hypothetical protein